MNPTYDYTTSGFDGFLSRSVDDLPQNNLDSAGPISNSVAFDRNQVSGSLGDTLRLGSIKINGSKGNIIMNDGQNDRLLIGQE
ncbi:hypothetical protein UFOVP1522_12 [uncultured Caudovirales phage]|uniref:Uncharacterized protein n=1 Tax=uncultured Caudovirales phage TaxID=2100421 RepID=A0A6J5QH06_9CAUD|nr:hypothetical protein UFOVP989_11 [uncultured Caudovirales phage]CAB4181636.1 hypothetical protein UFOVP1075_55 [uncultured Caudovirales phage]CAB4198756.1 hypothetical protein UFOVP1312_47 [uncultured Caudovirales phage]CAB4210443.1 hypothetical protein UFOVP1426_11 [uncultured Caudovirales phage]CAB5227193.1 hypothetical protein UFOVP1522_12 [uncultured Caudovirales phage]